VSALDLLLHLLGFLAPALAVGLMVAVAGRWIAPARIGLMRAWAIHAACGAAALLAGLLYFGRDGKMASYALLVLVVAASQWALGRGWRRG